MSWLFQNVSEHTVAWVFLSSVLGGVLGASIKLLFEDVIRPRIGWARETRAITERYTTPIIRSADALERRINNLIRNADARWMTNSEYYRLSTIYQCGEHLGWIRIVEREFGFLPFETQRRGREFNRRLQGIFRALSSHAYFRGFDDADAVGESALPRLMLAAVGEMMTKDGERPRVIEFTEFVKAYESDPQFRRWFQDLELFLASAEGGHSLRWDRLIAAGANLRALVRFLDPSGRMAGVKGVANIERVSSKVVREELASEFSSLITAHRSRPEDGPAALAP